MSQLPGIRISIMLLTASMVLAACTPTRDRINQGQQSSQSTTYAEPLSELTLAQQSSFDALNMLQTSTDEKNRLYSTFTGIVQSCYPPDTSFTIARTDLRTAMEQFVTRHCTNLALKKRNELAATAALAQEEYIVLHCHGNSPDINYENGLPLSGTWVMPGVLGRRDVILVW